MWTHVHCLVFIFAITCLLSLFIGGVLYLYSLLDIPDFRSLESYRPMMASRVVDRHGVEVERFFQENRIVVPLARMPALLPEAFVAAEDARFYSHQGVDVWSVLRALLYNVRAGGRAQGGSTITQQVTRSLLLSRKKLYSRKLKEAIFAYRIDSLLSKDEILYIYLNQIYLGEGSYGVAAAAHTYFGKEVSELGLAEMALLAGLPQAPSRYSPFKNPQLAKQRQAYVLNRMAEDGFISAAAAREAYAEELHWAAPDDRTEGAYFVQHVRNYLEQKYGRQQLLTGGLTIYTTFDRAVQDAASQAVKTGVDAVKSRQAGILSTPQASLVAMELQTGRVLALVGGTSFERSQFDRATQARRQPGSAMKPIVYAAALANGFRPDSLLDDRPLKLHGAGSGQLWEPRNFDNRFHGLTTLYDGLIYSRNIVTIKLLQETGVDEVIRLARKLGIRSELTADLSLALGSSGLSLLELTAAYTAFGNNGRYVAPLFVSRVEDRYGRVLEENFANPEQVLPEAVAGMMSGMLRGVIGEGTGKRAQGIKGAAGKTGTTDHNVDAWFIGYTDTMVAGVWLGNDLNEPLGAGETGGRAAAPIWRDFMGRCDSQGAGR